MADKMSKAAKKFYTKYEYDISTAVIGKFGGSYQTYETLGNTWRTKMEYRADIKDFLMFQTKTWFGKHLKTDNQGDTNGCISDLKMIYNLCGGIADYLSKYFAREAPDLTRAVAKQKIMNEIYFENSIFVEAFVKRYKKPLPLTDENWVKIYEGVVKMHQAIQTNPATAAMAARLKKSR